MVSIAASRRLYNSEGTVEPPFALAREDVSGSSELTQCVNTLIAVGQIEIVSDVCVDEIVCLSSSGPPLGSCVLM